MGVVKFKALKRELTLNLVLELDRVIGDHWRWWEAQHVEYAKRFSISLPCQAPQSGVGS